MCLIETFVLQYPNGARRPGNHLRYCPRGAPQRPCDRTQQVDRGVRLVSAPGAPVPPPPPSPPPPPPPPPHHIIEPRQPNRDPRFPEREPRPAERQKPTRQVRTIRLNLNPFTWGSRKASKPKSKMYLVRKTRSSAERPRTAPSTPRGATPRRSGTPPPERPHVIYVPVPPSPTGQVPHPPMGQMHHPHEPEIIRPRQHPEPPVMVHQGESPSPPFMSPGREHRRQRSRSKSSSTGHEDWIQYEERKRFIEEQERRQHAERAARDAERVARDAERIAREERRRRASAEQEAELARGQINREAKRNSDLERERRRLETENRLRLESQERQRRRHSQEERARQAAEERRRRQIAAERDRLTRAQVAGLPRRPRHSTVIHNRQPESLEARGDRVIHRRPAGSFEARRERVPHHGRGESLEARGDRVLQQDIRAEDTRRWNRRNSLADWFWGGAPGRDERRRHHDQAGRRPL